MEVRRKTVSRWNLNFNFEYGIKMSLSGAFKIISNVETTLMRNKYKIKTKAETFLQDFCITKYVEFQLST